MNWSIIDEAFTFQLQGDRLGPIQRQRIEALKVARELLERKPGALGLAVPNAVDLVSIASWIVTGEDPWLS